MVCMSTGLLKSKLSTVQRGTLFENHAIRLLENLSMSLDRVGGSGDGGVDLIGWWWLPTASEKKGKGRSKESITPALVRDNTNMERKRIRIIAQCKAETKKLGPNYVRELEGVLHRLHAHSPTNEKGVSNPLFAALLVSQSPFTKATLLHANSSPLPLFLLHAPAPDLMPESNQQAGLDFGFGSAVWNPALGKKKGLLGGEFDLRWDYDPNKSSDTQGSQYLSLWWKGRLVQKWTPEDKV